MIHVFIAGSKGIPARYGGFETFVEHLTAGKQSEAICYHVSCMNQEKTNFEYNGAECFSVGVPLPGAPGRILHVCLVLSRVEAWCRAHPGQQAIVCILGCRIGPLLIPHAARLHRLGVRIFCNPDGLEWKRDKWSAPVKKFLRLCEACLVTHSDLAICDSKNIEQYIRDTYGSRVKKTTFIAYGADVKHSCCPEERVGEWFDRFGIRRGEYYLIVGRFVPENNYETMIREFMDSDTRRDLVIITNVEQNKFYERLLEQTGFSSDPRIKFVGTVYDRELLKKIREEAFAYIHGHEVGGTNPSLLEALASTRINLLLDVGFNREVAEAAALYWNKNSGSLRSLIAEADGLSPDRIAELDGASTRRVTENYNWEKICAAYEAVFLDR